LKIINFLELKHIDYLLALTGYLVISLLVLGNIIVSPGTIGFFHDWFIGPYSEMNRLWANNGLYVWDSQFGNKVFFTDWIIRLSLLPIPFLGGEILSKGLLISCVTLSGFGAFCLGKRLKLGTYLSFAAGVLYIFSPIIYSRIVAGHIYYLISYFLSPLILESFLKGKEEPNNRYFVIAALLLSFAAIQLQFIVMIFLVLLIFMLVDFKRIKRGIIGLVIIFSLAFLITLSPIFLSQSVVKNAKILFSPTQLLSYPAVETASDLAKGFRILGYEVVPYSYLNLGTDRDKIVSNFGIMPQWVFYLDFLLPIIGFSVLLFRRDKYAISFSVLSLLGLYFLKAINPPFPEIFSYLFIHGFYIFREIWHIAFLYSFSLTFMIAFFIQWIVQLKIKPVLKIVVSISLICMIVVSNGYPLFLGNFAGYLQTYRFPSEYESLYKGILSNQSYNVLILPYVTPIRYDNLALEGVDPLIIDTPSMIFPSYIESEGETSPTPGLSSWLLSSIQENMTQNLGRVLSGFGIKYVVLRNGFVSNYPDYSPLGSLSSFRQKWYTPLAPILESQKDMKLVLNTPQYKIFENLNPSDKIFATSAEWGGLSDFDSLFLISNVTSISNVAVYPSISDRDSIILLDNAEESRMPVNDFIQLGGYANSFNAQEGWTDNAISFGYDHLLSSRLNHGLFSASQNSKISFELPTKYSNEPVEIWIKPLLWNKGGKIDIEINGQRQSLSLFSTERSFNLFKIFQGESDRPYHISIENINGMNLIEGVYVKEKDFQQVNQVNKSFLYWAGPQKNNNIIIDPSFAILNNKTKLPLYWNDTLNRCTKTFICGIVTTDGWDDRFSLHLSTKNTIDNIWSSIYGQQLNVKPKERYELISHMKLNKWAKQSHVALEGLNETANATGTTMTQPGNVVSPANQTANATGTAMNALSNGTANATGTAMNATANPTGTPKEKAKDVLSTASNTTANASLTAIEQAKNIMTNLTNNLSNATSNARGTAMSEVIKLITAASNASSNATGTTMTQPGNVVSPANKTSKTWDQFAQCPHGIDGPVEWQVFSCTVTIPENVTKIRLVLNAGWSSTSGKVAETSFDAISLQNSTVENQLHSVTNIENMPDSDSVKNKASLLNEATRIKYDKVNPALWNVHISTTKPVTIGFAEPFDENWQASVYKVGKKVGVAKSMPMYGTINSFHIEETGDFDVVLAFVPQERYHIGLLISGVTFVFSISYIIYDWRRNRNK
jgi:hypothetical protein